MEVHVISKNPDTLTGIRNINIHTAIEMTYL